MVRPGTNGGLLGREHRGGGRRRESTEESEITEGRSDKLHRKERSQRRREAVLYTRERQTPEKRVRSGAEG